jgi:hypothetical protein
MSSVDGTIRVVRTCGMGERCTSPTPGEHRGDTGNDDAQKCAGVWVEPERPDPQPLTFPERPGRQVKEVQYDSEGRYLEIEGDEDYDDRH